MDKRSSPRIVKIAEMLMQLEQGDTMEFHDRTGSALFFHKRLTVKDLKSLAASVLAQARGKP